MSKREADDGDDDLSADAKRQKTTTSQQKTNREPTTTSTAVVDVENAVTELLGALAGVDDYARCVNILCGKAVDDPPRLQHPTLAKKRNVVLSAVCRKFQLTRGSAKTLAELSRLIATHLMPDALPVGDAIMTDGEQADALAKALTAEVIDVAILPSLAKKGVNLVRGAAHALGLRDAARQLDEKTKGKSRGEAGKQAQIQALRNFAALPHSKRKDALKESHEDRAKHVKHWTTPSASVQAAEQATSASSSSLSPSTSTSAATMGSCAPDSASPASSENAVSVLDLPLSATQVTSIKAFPLSHTLSAQAFIQAAFLRSMIKTFFSVTNDGFLTERTAFIALYESVSRHYMIPPLSVNRGLADVFSDLGIQDRSVYLDKTDPRWVKESSRRHYINLRPISKVYADVLLAFSKAEMGWLFRQIDITPRNLYRPRRPRVAD